MKTTIRTATLLIFIFLAFSYSCKDQYDFSTDNIVDPNVDANIAIPLINASFTIDDFLKENDSIFIIKDNDNFVTIVFSFDIKQITAPEFFEGDYSGILEEINYDIETQKFELGLDELIDCDEFYIADPSLKVFITNYWDIPAQLQFLNFEYFPTEISTGIPVSGTFVDEWHSINRPVSPALFAITELVMDTSNSNIDEIIAARPNSITIGGLAQTIPGIEYSVDPASSDSIRMEIEIPLELRITNFLLTDTIEFNAAKELGSDTSKFESVNLNLVFENGFPLDIEAQVYFAGENHELLDSISAEKILVPTGNISGGKVVSESKYTKIIKIEGEKKNTLFNSSYLITKFKFNTANSTSGQTVKIYSDYRIGLKVGALAKLKT
jgi:hypothetical protein